MTDAEFAIPVGALRPKCFQTLDGTRAESLGLSSIGHGAILCEDDNGTRWTAFTDDMEFFRTLVETLDELDDFRLGGRYPFQREGWPDDWPVQP